MHATAAGFLATVVGSPIDVTKTRVMNAKPCPKTGALPYMGAMDCVLKTVQAEGIPLHACISLIRLYVRVT